MKKTILATLIFLLIGLPAHALNIKAGSYVGSGADDRAITGVGFQPDFVWIRGLHTSANGGAFRTSAMTGDNSYLQSTGGLTANLVQSLDADGFTIGSHGDVNTNTVTFSYVAIKADATYFAVGTYTGNGSDNRNITGVGFTPTGCFVRHNSNSWREPSWSISDMGADQSFLMADSTGGVAANLIQAFGSGSFQVGTSGQYVNNSGDRYDWFCWADLSGAIKSGTYAGNGADNRSITGFGFQPEFVWVRGATAYSTQHLFAQSTTEDKAYAMTANGGDTNKIQAREADGIQIGSSSGVNTNLANYYYWALNDYTPAAAPGGAPGNVYGNIYIQGGFVNQ